MNKYIELLEALKSTKWSDAKIERFKGLLEERFEHNGLADATISIAQEIKQEQEGSHDERQ